MSQPVPETPPVPVRTIVPYIPLLIFVLLGVLLAAITFQTFRQIEKMIINDELHDLGAIADLKVKRITDWQRRQIRRGESFQNGNILPEEFDIWLRQGAVPDTRRKKIQGMLEGIVRLDGYQGVSLFDKQGKVRISTYSGMQQNAEDAALAREAILRRKVVISDIHKSENGAGEIRMDLVAPLAIYDGKGEQVVGAAIFGIDPHSFLFPLLAEWPKQSQSAETLLVRRDGKDVLFLNELRHLKGSALALRIPLAAFTLPAVMAVLGKTSSQDGFDYRGVAVVSEMRSVPGSDWFLISKVDKNELLAPIKRLKEWSLSLALAFTVLGGSLIFMWLKANHARHKLMQAQHSASVERGMLLEHLSYLIKYANDIILVFNETGQIVEANQRASEAYGYSRNELLQLGVSDLHLQTEDPGVFGDQIKQLVEQGELRFEDINLRKDGTSFHVEVSARFIDVHGAKYVQAILRDITVRKFAEEELLLYGAIVSHMEEGVFLVRACDGVIVYANPKFEQVFGYGPGGLIGKHVGVIYDPAKNSPDEIMKAIGDSLNSKGNWDGDVINVKRDGTSFWCHASVSSIAHHRYGTVWVVIHQDITERRLAANRLSESEERFRSMADKAPVMIWMAEANGEQQSRLCHDCRSHFMRAGNEYAKLTLVSPALNNHDCRTFFNQQWHDFTGLTSDPSQNHNWQRIVHPDDRLYCLDICESAFYNAQPFKLAYRLLRHDGVYRWVQDTGVPRFTEDGQFLGFIGTCIDITDQKLFDEMRAEIERIGRLNVAGEMASGLAHELSQPLSAAGIYLDGCLNRMAGEDWDREKLRNAVMQAQSQTRRAGKIINHLKELMRKQGHTREIMDINLIIRESINFLRQDMIKYGIEVVQEFSDLPLGHVNRTEIEQVLLNLMKNSIDAMSFQVRRELRLATQFLNSGMIMVTVSDTGTGIHQDELETIFNPFQTTKPNGLGLGLGICRSLIENHGGKIWAEKRSECGMEFNFTLPVVAL